MEDVAGMKGRCREDIWGRGRGDRGDQRDLWEVILEIQGAWRGDIVDIWEM